MGKFSVQHMLVQLVYILIIDIGLWIFYFIHPHPALLVLALLGVVFALFTIWFFRNPKREIIHRPDAIIAPADGQIVAIQREKDSFFFEGREVTRVSIFLNVFNVHINRIPIDGEIIFQKYNHGKFINAFSEKASLDNEQNMIGLNTRYGPIMVKQIAGLIARRIICIPATGEQVTQGQIYGMIKFGSRTDILIESDVQLQIKIGDRVKGGLTILGVFKD